MDSDKNKKVVKKFVDYTLVVPFGTWLLKSMAGALVSFLSSKLISRLWDKYFKKHNGDKSE